MNQTITAMYASRTEAERAAEQIRSLGVSDVAVHDAAGSGTDASTSGTASSGIWGDIKSLFSSDDRPVYEEGVRRGRTVLTVRTDEAQADRVVEALDRTEALDVDSENESYRASGWTADSTTADTTYGSGATGAATGSSYGVDENRTPARTAGMDGDERIQLVEEQLAVAKRDTVRGGARIRTYTVDTPVEEQITLREEHVHVERVPVNETVINADNLFQDRTIEVSERAEEAVVGKRTVVTEELRVSKDVDERVETVRDTVRHTEVDIDNLNDDRLARTDDRR